MAADPVRSVYRNKVVYQDEDVQEVFDNNRDWALNMARINPKFFPDSVKGQSPKYLWIGCADSRVVPAQITGLLPGDIFVHRNVGNMAKLSDTNCMSSVEYSVGALKVKHIIVCGHYNCGAVQAALKMPLEAPGIANFWISDLRDVRNTHWEHLVGVPPAEQLSRLCEFNVVRQTFNVCTSPPVQAAWDKGQELHVHGVIFDIKTGALKRVVGPVSAQVDKTEIVETEIAVISGTPRHSVTNTPKHSQSQVVVPQPQVSPATREISSARPSLDTSTAGPRKSVCSTRPSLDTSAAGPKKSVDLVKEVKAAEAAESTLTKAAVQLQQEKSQLLHHMADKEKHIKLLEEQLDFLRTEFKDIRMSDTSSLLAHVHKLASSNPSSVTPELAAELSALEKMVGNSKPASTAVPPPPPAKPATKPVEAAAATTVVSKTDDVVVPASRVKKSRGASRDVVGGLLKLGMFSAAVLTMKHWDDLPEHLNSAKSAVSSQTGDMINKWKSWQKTQAAKTREAAVATLSAPSMVAEVAEAAEHSSAEVAEKCHLDDGEEFDAVLPTAGRLFKLAAA